MKKFILALCAFAFISTTFLSSCKKYVDGPAFSLRTKKARFQGDWKIDSYTVNGADQTDAYKKILGDNFVWHIKKGGTYTIEGNLSDAGTWKLGGDKDDAYFQSSTAGSAEESYRILRLANKELWLRQVQSNGELDELKLKQ